MIKNVQFGTGGRYFLILTMSITFFGVERLGKRVFVGEAEVSGLFRYHEAGFFNLHS